MPSWKWWTDKTSINKIMTFFCKERVFQNARDILGNVYIQLEESDKKPKYHHNNHSEDYVCIYRQNLVLNDLQRLICHKTQTTNLTTEDNQMVLYRSLKTYFFSTILQLYILFPWRSYVSLLIQNGTKTATIRTPHTSINGYFRE